MKHLPFDYVVRDILYTTYQFLLQLQAGTVVLKQQEGLLLYSTDTCAEYSPTLERTWLN